MQARIPGLDVSVAFIAVRDGTDRRVPLLDALLDAAIRTS